MAKAGSPTGGKVQMTQLAHGAFSNGTSIDIRRLDGYDYARFDGTLRGNRTYWYGGKLIHEWINDFDNSPAWDRYIHSKPLYPNGTKIKKGQKVAKQDPDYYPAHLHLDYNNGSSFENPNNVMDRRIVLELASGLPWKSTSYKYTKWSSYPDHQIPITNQAMTFRLYKEGVNIKFQITSGAFKGMATVYRRNAGSRSGTSFKASLVTGPKSGIMVKNADKIVYEVHLGNVVQSFDNRNLPEPPQADPKDQEIAELTKKISELEGSIKNQAIEVLGQVETINRLNAQIGDLKGEIDTIQRENRTYEEQNSDLVKDNLELEKKVSAQRKELRKLQAKLTEYEDKNSNQSLFIKILEWTKSLVGSKTTDK